MAETPNPIPGKTIERLSEYRRTLSKLRDAGVSHVFSHVLAGMQGIKAVQVRRDLMLIGFTSDAKRGYDVGELIKYIGNILDAPVQNNVAVIGMGNLGRAISRYFNSKELKMKVVAAFDTDPAKAGTEIDGISCYNMDDFEEVVRSKDVQIAILTVPSSVVESTKLPIINAGIKGVINFASRPVLFPEGIVYEHIDLTTVLEKVAYFIGELDDDQQ